GADVLRIDTGALADFFHDADPAHYVADLRGADIHNIEVIGITDDVAADPTKGTTVKLNAADVLNFSGDALGQDTLYVVGNQGDKLQISTADAPNWVDGDNNAANGVTKTGTVDDGQGETFNVYTTTASAHLYVDTDITVQTA